MHDIDTRATAFLATLVEREVTFVRLAANSLLLYIESVPEAKEGWIIWLEPTWNYRNATRVLTGSRQAQDEDEGGFERAAKAVATLEGQRLRQLAIDPVSFDLRIELSNTSLVQTFASDPEDDRSWHIENRATEDLLEASPSGLDWP